jgi:hypothetical protein
MNLFRSCYRVRWLEITMNSTYSQLLINNSEVQNFSLINNSISQSIDQLSVPIVSYKL